MKKNNYAFIDNENVNISVQKQWWKMDREKLLERLQKRFSVTKAYMFMWYLEKYQPMYDFFQGLWYELVFKPVNPNPHIPNKGNVDAELVLQAMIDKDVYDKAVLVSGDGDFACLVRHLRKEKKLARVIVPNESRYANLLEEATWKQKIYNLTTMQDELEYFPQDDSQEVEEKSDGEEHDDKFYA